MFSQKWRDRSGSSEQARKGGRRLRSEGPRRVSNERAGEMQQEEAYRLACPKW